MRPSNDWNAAIGVRRRLKLERELVQIGLQVLGLDAVVCPAQPGLQVAGKPGLELGQRSGGRSAAPPPATLPMGVFGVNQIS